MNFLRNLIGVIAGLLVAGVCISLGIKVNPEWINYTEFSPFENWQQLLVNVKGKSSFFAALLFFGGVGVTAGGVVTAIIVKYAKVAYAILIGFIMLFIAMVDIIIYPYHPTFYKISIFLIFFPFSWLGGKIVEVIYERKKRKRIKAKAKEHKM